ncbi:recombinase family protein (plasmid) [Rhizobium sp. CB3171]|uniref:recombinase family protein n=1 Tax=Rhizobium sp. CB3171 TaxID=3039157 RepID=UPI0024B1F12D|nr:recombinase family protein [Rhizobium sp. CB3171]WFU07213.1 recombinase family protein [Rhizobium sp. CB3171]
MGQRAVIYCRVSTADQSCERQEDDLTAFAERAGYEVTAIFKETGSGAKLDRTERKKVMALAQARQVDAILVTELSRWGRSTTDLLNTLGELESWKVSVIAMNGMTFPVTLVSARIRSPTSCSGINGFTTIRIYKWLLKRCFLMWGKHWSTRPGTGSPGPTGWEFRG